MPGLFHHCAQLFSIVLLIYSILGASCYEFSIYSENLECPPVRQGESLLFDELQVDFVFVHSDAECQDNCSATVNCTAWVTEVN